jgi:hypothetical protein
MISGLEKFVNIKDSFRYFFASCQLVFSISNTHFIYNPIGSLFFWDFIKKSIGFSALAISHFLYSISDICIKASLFKGSLANMLFTILIALVYSQILLYSSIFSNSSSGIYDMLFL